MVHNLRSVPTTVFVSFGSDSVVLPSDWSFCASTSGLNCSFDLEGSDWKFLPLAGKHLNATFSFDAAVGCGATKAEVNINNPAWNDILDVSLVDGYNNKVSIEVVVKGDKPVFLGPPHGEIGNEKVFGVFPYGCDICVARQSPPCGIPIGTHGCKSGSQYDPDVPCQYQGPKKGGGERIRIALHEN
jgi:hypothetical protein